MRFVLAGGAALLAAAMLGCGSSGTPVTDPATPALLPSTSDIHSTPGAAATLGTVAQRGDVSTSALALYTIELDPTSLSATARLKETRSGQANDDLYALSIDSFLNARSFQVTGVSSTASTIDLGYTLAHPFPAPSDPTGMPNGSTNRADLGIAGLVLLLADVPSATGNTYFTDVVANTALTANQDAFFAPGGLLTLTSTASAFPYWQLVDETMGGTGSRIGIANGGDVAGNFGTDGWTRSEFGATNDGWTGYGVLHQGQVTAGTMSLNRPALGTGLTLDVAIVAKYNDPRGGATPAEKKANRLPPATADASLFAYRMPHGALDVSRIAFAGQSGDFLTNVISAATLSFHIDDWDARATETTEADLSADASFTNVAVGESGVPTVDVCIPGVLGDTTVTAPIATVVDDDTSAGGDAGIDSGVPGDALYFSELVTKSAGSGQTPGDYVGLVRATDIESGLVIGLDGNLAPLATPPAPIAYQAFTATMLPDNDPPSATVVLTSADPLLSGTMPSLGITAIADPDGDALNVLVDWGDGLGFQTIATGLTPGYPNQTPSGPQMNNTDLVNDTINVVVRLDDGTTQVDYPLSYQVGPNRAPIVTAGSVTLASSTLLEPATFALDATGLTVADPEGDALTYTVSATPTSGSAAAASGIAPGSLHGYNASPVMGPWNVANSTVAFNIYANDTLHPTTGGTLVPASPLTGTIASGSFAHVLTNGNSVQPNRIERLPNGNFCVVGQFAGTVDFDPGAGTQNRTSNGGNDIYCLVLDNAGNYVDVIAIGGTGADNGFGLAIAPSGTIFVSGSYNATVDFDPGPGTVSRTATATDSFVVAYSPTFALQWVWTTTTSALADFPDGIALDSLGNVRVTGRLSGSADFDPSGATVTLTSAGGVDIFVASLNGSTGALQWAVRAGGATDDQGRAVVCGAANAALIVGEFTGTVDFDPGAGTVNRTSNGGSDAFAWVLSSTGAFSSAGGFGGTGNDIAFDVRLDSGGNPRIVGQFVNTVDFDFGAGVQNRTSLGGTDMFCLGLSPAGAFQWALGIGGTGNERAICAAIGPADTVYIGSAFANTVDFDPGAGTANRTSVAGFDAALAAYTSAGAFQWVAQPGGTVSESVQGVALDPTGRPRAALLISGAGTVDFDPGVAVQNRTSTGTFSTGLWGLQSNGTW